MTNRYVFSVAFGLEFAFLKRRGLAFVESNCCLGYCDHLSHNPLLFFHQRCRKTVRQSQAVANVAAFDSRDPKREMVSRPQKSLHPTDSSSLTPSVFGGNGKILKEFDWKRPKLPKISVWGTCCGLMLGNTRIRNVWANSTDAATRKMPSWAAKWKTTSSSGSWLDTLAEVWNDLLWTTCAKTESKRDVTHSKQY